MNQELKESRSQGEQTDGMEVECQMSTFANILLILFPLLFLLPLFWLMAQPLSILINLASSFLPAAEPLPDPAKFQQGRSYVAYIPVPIGGGSDDDEDEGWIH